MLLSGRGSARRRIGIESMAPGARTPSDASIIEVTNRESLAYGAEILRSPFSFHGELLIGASIRTWKYSKKGWDRIEDHPCTRKYPRQWHHRSNTSGHLLLTISSLSNTRALCGYYPAFDHTFCKSVRLPCFVPSGTLHSTIVVIVV